MMMARSAGEGLDHCHLTALTIQRACDTTAHKVKAVAGMLALCSLMLTGSLLNDDRFASTALQVEKWLT